MYVGMQHHINEDGQKIIGTRSAILKTRLEGAIQSFMITAPVGVTFLSTADMLIGNVLVEGANIRVTTNNLFVVGTLKTALPPPQREILLLKSASEMIPTTTYVNTNKRSPSISNEAIVIFIILLLGLTTTNVNVLKCCHRQH